MLIRIRRRLACEDGISLVEMMISMLILSVGLMALLGSFMVSARSILDQRAKATATRIASQELETLRDQVWRTGFVPPAGTRTLPAAETDGRPYQITTTVTDSTNPPGLKHIATTVAWNIAGVARSATSTTSVSSGTQAPATVPTDAHMTVEMAPNPVRVYPISSTSPYWRPFTDIVVKANVVGMTFDGQIRLTWLNADGSTGTDTINKSNGTWEKAIPGTSFILALNSDLEGVLNFTVEAIGASELTTSYALTTLGYNDVEMQLNVRNVTTATNGLIRVYAPHSNGSCNGGSRCNNIEGLHVWLTNAPPQAKRAWLSWTAGDSSYNFEFRKTTTEYPGIFAETPAAQAYKWQPTANPPTSANLRVHLHDGSTWINTEGVACSSCSIPFAVPVVVP